MSAYVIVYLEGVSDAAKMTEYRRLGVPTLKKFGAKTRVLNGKMDVPEGSAPQAVVMLEFPSLQDAQTWYRSPEYQEALQHRLAGARCTVVMVEGVTPSPH